MILKRQIQTLGHQVIVILRKQVQQPHQMPVVTLPSLKSLKRRAKGKVVRNKYHRPKRKQEEEEEEEEERVMQMTMTTAVMRPPPKSNLNPNLNPTIRRNPMTK